MRSKRSGDRGNGAQLCSDVAMKKRPGGTTHLSMLRSGNPHVAARPVAPRAVAFMGADPVSANLASKVRTELELCQGANERANRAFNRSCSCPSLPMMASRLPSRPSSRSTAEKAFPIRFRLQSSQQSDKACSTRATPRCDGVH